MISNRDERRIRSKTRLGGGAQLTEMENLGKREEEQAKEWKGKKRKHPGKED